jgi:Flp pilus assembly protein TadG
MAGSPRRRAAPGERGAAAVEFALVVPLLLLILFGIISYGYMLSFRQAISQGVAEGARAAAVAPVGSDHVALATAAIDEALSGYQGITCGSTVACTIAVDPCATSPAYATVTVDYDYGSRPLTPALPGLGLVMPDHLVYTSTVEVSC